MLLSAGDHPAGAMLSHVYKPMTLEALPPRPSVSVAITCYNYGQFLSACLDSCLNQTVPIDQIVVVDDGSTDASWQVLSGYAGSGSRVQAIHQANAGMCAATNTALRACTGDVVLLLDADDMFAPTRVERVLAALRQPIDGELPGWVHHALRRFSSTHSNLGLFSNYPANALPRGYLAERVLRFGETTVVTVTSGLAFRREVLEAIGPIDDDRSTAQDMQLRLAASLLSPVAWIPEPLSLYRIHGAAESAGGVLASLARVRANRERCEKLHAWIQNVLRRRMPEASAIWPTLDGQPWYQWLVFIEQWWSGSSRDRKRLYGVLAHPKTREAPLEQRIYMRSALWLPRSAFVAVTQFMFGASPFKAAVRRLLGRR